MKMYTVWGDYFATGEGRTLFAWIGYAPNKKGARKMFADHFGTYFAKGCEVEKGVVRNTVTNGFDNSLAGINGFTLSD